MNPLKLHGQFDAYIVRPGGLVVGPVKIGSTAVTFAWESLGEFRDRDGDKYSRIRTNPSGTVYLVPESEITRASNLPNRKDAK